MARADVSERFAVAGAPGSGIGGEHLAGHVGQRDARAGGELGGEGVVVRGEKQAAVERLAQVLENLQHCVTAVQALVSYRQSGKATEETGNVSRLDTIGWKRFRRQAHNTEAASRFQKKRFTFEGRRYPHGRATLGSNSGSAGKIPKYDSALPGWTSALHRRTKHKSRTEANRGLTAGTQPSEIGVLANVKRANLDPGSKSFGDPKSPFVQSCDDIHYRADDSKQCFGLSSLASIISAHSPHRLWSSRQT